MAQSFLEVGFKPCAESAEMPITVTEPALSYKPAWSGKQLKRLYPADRRTMLVVPGASFTQAALAELPMVFDPVRASRKSNEGNGCNINVVLNR